MQEDIFDKSEKQVEYALQDKVLSNEDAERLKIELAERRAQQKKLDSAFSNGEIDPKDYNKQSWDIRRGIGQIVSEIDGTITKKRQKSEKRVVRRIACIALILVAVYAVFKIPAEIHAHRTIAGIPEPVQIDIADLDIAETTKTIDRDGYWAELEYLASYDIRGLVVALDDYDHKIGEVSAFDKAIPRDLSLTWGVSAQYSNKIKWSHGGRAVKWEYTPDLWQSRGLSEHDFINSISNNHLITDDKSIYRKIKRVRRGDYIEMKGYLVRGKITDKKTGYEYTFSSSLVRDDYTRNMLKDSSTSCEIIYLTSIEWLD